jgi:hypothetical protein
MKIKSTLGSWVVLPFLVCGYGSNSSEASSGGTQEATARVTESQPPTSAKNDYGNGDNWLCRPARQDACAVDLTTTVIAADGKLTREAWAANPKALIDCFYVYPTVSNEPTPNSDMIPGPNEQRVVRVQFARFASQCRPFAPLYRQRTLAGLRASSAGNPWTAELALAYNDVLDAWNYYLEHDNQGRGVVLIGHSQGSRMLAELIKNEIDGKPIQSRIISAVLLGANLPVPQGQDAGGAFQKVPLCRSAKQTGCVITYSSFRSNAPPPENSLFGKVPGEGMASGCTNPAALGGGSGEMHSYFWNSSNSGVTTEPMSWVTPMQTKPWVTPVQPIETPFVSVPGLLSAECVSNQNGSYLAVTVHGDAAGPRTSDIIGDVVVNGHVLPEWGLHLIDVNLAMGNLVELVGQESKAYLAAKKK